MTDAIAKPKRSGWRRGLEPDYISFDQYRSIYEGLTGDREEFVGYDRRFEEWALLHPRANFGST